MSTLVAIEMQRLLSRRLFRVIATIVGVAAVAGPIIAMFKSSSVHPLVPANISSVLVGIGAPLALLSLLIGASFAGADWGSRTMTTTLTWQPRRVRLLAAKVLACVVVVVVWATAVQIVIAVLLFVAAVARGAHAADAGIVAPRIALTVARIGLMTAGAAIAGVSLAMIGRNTAAALAATFGYFIVIEQLIRGLRPGWGTWLLGENMAILVSGSHAEFAPGRSVMVAGVIVSIYIGCIFLTSLGNFRAKDLA